MIMNTANFYKTKRFFFGQFFSMGKSLAAAARFQNFARIITSESVGGSKQAKPTSNNEVSHSESQPRVSRVDPAQLGMKVDNSVGMTCRVPLSEVVSDCVKRWFQDTLKVAKAGDSAMQLLVGQMYNSGYGVRKDIEKGCSWIARVSKGRSSAWKVSNKQPGYNASDSDSEVPKDVRR